MVSDFILRIKDEFEEIISEWHHTLCWNLRMGYLNTYMGNKTPYNNIYSVSLMI